MQKLSPSEIPFSTTDAILAFCLYISGVPFHNSKQPLRNEYDIEILKKLGYRGEVNLLEVAKDAIEKGKRGRIRYIFKRTPKLGKLLKIFSEQEKEITDPNSTIDASQWLLELMQKVAKGEMEPAEASLRSFCVGLKMNVLFRNIWKELPGMVVIPNEGAPRKFDTQVNVRTSKGMQTLPAKGVEYPGFVQVSTNASDKTLKRLKLIP